MIKLIKVLFSLVIFLFSSHNLNAQAVTTVSTTGQVIAEVMPVFAAYETSQLNFGRFSPGPQGGEIILSPQSTISVMGSVFVSTGVHNAASFYVTGDENAAFSITLPENPVILSHTESSRTMLVDSWSSVPLPGIGAGMLKNGYQTVYVGATLRVGTVDDNPVGVYTGSYEITFDFN